MGEWLQHPVTKVMQEVTTPLEVVLPLPGPLPSLRSPGFRLWTTVCQLGKLSKVKRQKMPGCPECSTVNWASLGATGATVGMESIDDYRKKANL